MIYIGLDDTDIEGSPGTNKLAISLAARLADRYDVVRIVRHQLLDDPRVPYTSKNGCASMLVKDRELGIRQQESGIQLDALADELSAAIVRWCPAGSDPGLCIAYEVPEFIVEFAERCRRELVKQSEAREAATAAALLLRGLGGTQDGVIGALAAVGLCVAGQEGRIVYSGVTASDLSEVNGAQTLAQLAKYGIDQVIEQETGRTVTHGIVNVGKKLRPNIRQRRTVLFVVRPGEELDGQADWQAVKAL